MIRLPAPLASPLARSLTFGLALPALVLSLSATGCAGPAGDVCELSGELPTTDEVGAGRVVADQDGSAFAADGTWKRPPGGSLAAGSLDIIIENDENGDATADLIDAATFPICVQIGARGESSGQANLVSGGYVSDASHGGTLAILGEEDGNLIGRFSFELATPGGDTTVFSDGMFRVPER